MTNTLVTALSEPQRDFVLIDDDQVFCNLMAQHAKRRGVTLDCFLNVSELGSMNHFSRYHVAIVDYRLEQMTGLEIAEYFPTFYNQMPVLLISQSPLGSCEGMSGKWPSSVKTFVQKCEGPDAILDHAQALQRLESQRRASDQPGMKTPTTEHTMHPSHSPKSSNLAPQMSLHHAVPPQAQSGPATAIPIIDRHVLKQLRDVETDGSGAFVANLLKTFIQNGEQEQRHIHSALAGFEYEQLANSAHKIKGSASCVGAVGLADICGRLEVHARHQNLLQCYTLSKKYDSMFRDTVDSIRKTELPYLERSVQC